MNDKINLMPCFNFESNSKEHRIKQAQQALNTQRSNGAKVFKRKKTKAKISKKARVRNR